MSAAIAVRKHLGGVSFESYSTLFIFGDVISFQVIKQIGDVILATATVYPECLHLIAFCSMSSSLKPQCVQKTDTALFSNTSRSDQGLSVFSLKTSVSPDSF